jgi:hypothetical protein
MTLWPLLLALPDPTHRQDAPRFPRPLDKRPPFLDAQPSRAQCAVASSRAFPVRIGRPDLFYVKVAMQYAELIDKGHRQPIAEISRRRGVDVKKVRDMVRQARIRGFLTVGRQA